MAWSGPYYYQSERTPAGPRRRYVGRGELAECAAMIDAAAAALRDIKRRERQAARDRLADIDGQLRELEELADLVARAALAAAGYRQHHRGEWRKQRGRRNEDR